MPNPLTDKIDMADAGVKIGLYCAQCGEKVLSNQTHECPINESTQENKETKNETDKA